MGMIKAQGDREQAMSEAEWKQLSNLIENDRRERVSGPIYIRTHMMHIYSYIRTYTYKHTYIYDASSVISFALASLLSMVQYGCIDEDCIHSKVQYGYNKRDRMHSKL